MESTATRLAAERGEIYSPIACGLALLRQAREYAVDLSHDPWDFAVEISSLREAGMSASDLRWLVCKEFVEHAAEVTVLGKDGREFQPTGNLTFGERTCFILTEGGASFAANLSQSDATLVCLPLHEACSAEINGSVVESLQNGSDTAPVVADELNGDVAHEQTPPTWDGSRHELRVKRTLVKIFKLPSPNQEAILMAFEEEGWPPRIDDPLPRHPDLDPKRRLHDAIKGLNRNQKASLIRFMGDGTGEGIRWEPRAAAAKVPNGKAK